MLRDTTGSREFQQQTEWRLRVGIAELPVVPRSAPPLPEQKPPGVKSVTQTRLNGVTSGGTRVQPLQLSRVESMEIESQLRAHLHC